jgi:hypothetical protein
LLDAMRRGKSPLDSGEPIFALDDSTIGEVINGLFEPSFEGVLAAMAGENVDEGSIQEPTYEPESREQRAYQKGAEPPPTLPEESMEHDSFEPPIGEGDSRHYPATAALTAPLRDHRMRMTRDGIPGCAA